MAADLHITPDETIDTLNRVFFSDRQKSIGESIAADIWDDVIGFVPFVGDAVTNVPRLSRAVTRNDRDATVLHGAAAVVGVVPILGDIIDAFLPSNSILRILDKRECLATATDPIPCLVDKDTIDWKILSAIKAT